MEIDALSGKLTVEKQNLKEYRRKEQHMSKWTRWWLAQCREFTLVVVGSFGLLIGSTGRSKGTAGTWQPARGRGTELACHLPVLIDCQSFVALSAGGRLERFEGRMC